MRLSSTGETSAMVLSVMTPSTAVDKESTPLPLLLKPEYNYWRKCSNDIKPSFARFLMAWTLQGLWVCFSLAAALSAITSETRSEPDVFALVGFLVWLVGFAIEGALLNKWSSDMLEG